jgi:hypothetical protein
MPSLESVRVGVHFAAIGFHVALFIVNIPIKNYFGMSCNVVFIGYSVLMLAK